MNVKLHCVESEVKGIFLFAFLHHFGKITFFYSVSSVSSMDIFFLEPWALGFSETVRFDMLTIVNWIEFDLFS